jgi:predicted Zn-dependent protease
MYSQDFESEADYVGLYVVARAGMPIDNAPRFWRRMGSQVAPGAISHGTTHPPTAQRFVALEAAVAEIKAKQAAGQPLLPNEKSKAKADPAVPSGAQLRND